MLVLQSSQIAELGVYILHDQGWHLDFCTAASRLTADGDIQFLCVNLVPLLKNCHQQQASREGSAARISARFDHFQVLSARLEE